MKKGNFQEHIEEKNNSEFAYLYEGFNEMEDRIQDLIQEVYEQKELKQRAELKQLQEPDQSRISFITAYFPSGARFTGKNTKALRSSPSFWEGISGILREMLRIM